MEVRDEILITPTEKTSAYALGKMLVSLGEECPWLVQWDDRGFIRLVVTK